MSEEDIVEDSRISDAAGINSSLGALMRTEGWKLLMEVVDLRIRAIEVELFAPTTGTDSMYGAADRIGSLRELKFFRDLPGNMRRDSKMVLELLGSKED